MEQTKKNSTSTNGFGSVRVYHEISALELDTSKEESIPTAASACQTRQQESKPSLMQKNKAGEKAN
jgi:hypothetical protein